MNEWRVYGRWASELVSGCAGGGVGGGGGGRGGGGWGGGGSSV